MLSMCIPCNSAGHCTSTKGYDKKKPSIALLHNLTLWYLTLRLTPSTGYNCCSSKYGGLSLSGHSSILLHVKTFIIVCMFLCGLVKERNSVLSNMHIEKEMNLKIQ